MDGWIDVRRRARLCHEAALKKANGNRHAGSLIEAALKLNDLRVRRFTAGTTFAKGVLGTLERESLLVNVVKGLDPEQEAFVIAHEIGHFEIHTDPSNEVTVSTSSLGGDAVDGRAKRSEGYSPRERKELQADVFAGEFLCPSDWLREEYLVRGKRPSQIAVELGLPYGLVLNQCIRALLLPALPPVVKKEMAPALTLDSSQQVAATWNKGRLLVDAGPGTGKTRTLVHRVKYLLDSGVAPGKILALTFSNRAADEMRERLSATDPEAAIQIWVGTFHAFGLELITKWPSAAARTGKVRPLDEAGSLGVLEENLEHLPLKYYQNLYEPAFDLAPVLRAISRCKDALITPDQYIAAAKQSLAEARNDDEKEAAEKAIEVGEIYAAYEAVLLKSDAVDFGDCIGLAIKVVTENADARAYVFQFDHIVVDEYQDVNLASSKLLATICSENTALWVVADPRQSIYRFRGAEPTNVERFNSEFGGGRHSLDTNYRSTSPIVEMFRQFSQTMGRLPGQMEGKWKAVRGSGDAVSLTVAPTVEAEAEAIRDKINEFKAKNIPYGDQVILARTRKTLLRITRVLERLGVPLVYLGDLFERDEVRTLLALLSIDSESSCGLLRIAQLPQYSTTREEALKIILWAQSNRVRIFDSLKRLNEIEGLNAQCRSGINKLAKEVDGLTDAGAWTMLTTWLFERSEYLRNIIERGGAAAKQQLSAIYHVLKLLEDLPISGGYGRRAFLERIRHLIALNQDHSFRKIASEATDEDAVQVMTIHGSKGLEFRAVHLPGLATRYMPASRQGTRCPPPTTLKDLLLDEDKHSAEESCLFFVALSRAQDYLHLSRAERYTAAQKASESKFLNKISNLLKSVYYKGSGLVIDEPPLVVAMPPRSSYEEEELSTYQECPSRYRYEYVDKVWGASDRGAFIQFHRCVHKTLAWIEKERQDGKEVTAEAAVSHLANEWATGGPVKHGFNRYYRHTAEVMVTRMAQNIAGEDGMYDREPWQVELDGKEVLFTPDRVVKLSDGSIRVQRIKTGRQTKSETGKAIYGLLRHGADMRYGEGKAIVETLYLASGKAVEADAGKTTVQLQQYTDAIRGIEGGDFTPNPSQYCPNCPYYFVCGK